MRVSTQNRRLVLETLVAEGLQRGGLKRRLALSLAQEARAEIERAEDRKLILLNIATHAHERILRLDQWRDTARALLRQQEEEVAA